MSSETAGRETDPEIVYADIFRLPHHVSNRHPRMSMHDRAAQFSPYAALTGYNDMISEEARQTDNRIELGEEDLKVLNRKLDRIGKMLGEGKRPEMTVTYFIPDPFKPGGRYETVTEKIRKIDTAEQKIILDRKVTAGGAYMEILIPDILEIRQDAPEGQSIKPAVR